MSPKKKEYNRTNQTECKYILFRRKVKISTPLSRFFNVLNRLIMFWLFSVLLYSKSRKIRIKFWSKRYLTDSNFFLFICTEVLLLLHDHLKLYIYLVVMVFRLKEKKESTISTEPSSIADTSPENHLSLLPVHCPMYSVKSTFPLNVNNFIHLIQ